MYCATVKTTTLFSNIQKNFDAIFTVGTILDKILKAQKRMVRLIFDHTQMSL